MESGQTSLQLKFRCCIVFSNLDVFVWSKCQNDRIFSIVSILNKKKNLYVIWEYCHNLIYLAADQFVLCSSSLSMDILSELECRFRDHQIFLIRVILVPFSIILSTLYFVSTLFIDYFYLTNVMIYNMLKITVTRQMRKYI